MYAGPSEDESSPAANQDSAVERSFTDGSAPPAGSTGHIISKSPASSSDDSSIDDSYDEDVDQHAPRKIRSSVAQVRMKNCWCFLITGYL